MALFVAGGASPVSRCPARTFGKPSNLDLLLLFLRRRGLRSARRRLPLLQPLLLLYVFLLQLLRLLLVLLLSLLLSRIVRILICQLLMFFLLPLLQSLPFLVLLLLELLLLLLVFLVRLCISRVGRRWALHGGKVVGMNRSGGACVVFRSRLRGSPIGGRIVGASGGSRRQGIVATELSGPGCRRDRRLAVICRRTQLRITTGGLHVLHLSACRRNMPVACRRFVSSGWPGIHSTFTAVVADPILGAVDDGFVVDVVDDCYVHIGHRPVVEKVSIVPASAREAFSKIAEAVVDAPVESDLRAPIAVIVNKRAVRPSPVRRGPKKTDFRGLHPCSRHPVVIAVVVAPGPVSRRPDIAVAGAHRLLVDRQRRRAERDRDSHLPERSRRHDDHDDREQRCSNGTNTHFVFS